jgi:hypothetical protein
MKNNSIKPTMLAIKSTWNGKQTAKLIPISNDCPYVECIMDPESKIMVVISKVSKQTLHMLPRLDDNGDPKILKVTKRPSGKTVMEERKTIETFQEYYIDDKTAIMNIIDLHSVNPEEIKVIVAEILSDSAASQK